MFGPPRSDIRASPKKWLSLDIIPICSQLVPAPHWLSSTLAVIQEQSRARSPGVPAHAEFAPRGRRAYYL